MPSPKRYRRKPGPPVEAVQWDGSEESKAAIVTWSKGAIADVFNGRYCLVGDSKAFAGDWIIREPHPAAIHGYSVFAVCRPVVFQATYEPVEEEGGEGSPDGLAEKVLAEFGPGRSVMDVGGGATQEVDWPNVVREIIYIADKHRVAHPQLSTEEGKSNESREHAYCVEEFLRKVTQWNGSDEDELAEAIEAAEKLTGALDAHPEQRGGGSNV